MIEARHKSAGMDHIGLTINILWQLWKARNDRVFKVVDRYPLKTVQKAHKEWMEYNEAKEKEKDMSIPKTIRVKLNQQWEGSGHDRIYIN